MISLLAAVDVAASDPVTVIAGVLVTAITALTGVQTAQMSGLRHDFQTYRADQEAKMRRLEEAVEDLQRTPSQSTPRGRARPVKSAQTTTRGRAERRNSA